MSRSQAHKARNDQTRSAFPNLGAANILPRTDVVASTQAKEHGLHYAVEHVPNGNGAKIHWLGDRSSSKAILYFHGISAWAGALNISPC